MIAPARLLPLAPFQGASPALVRLLCEQGVERRYRAGATLFHAGSEPKGWYVVLEGTVRVVRVAESRQHVVHTEGPGGTLGEVPLFSGGRYPATCVATDAVVTAFFARDALLRGLRASPELSLLLLRRLAHRVETLIARLDERSALTVRERLISFLRERARPDGSVVLGMSQQDLAEELGTVRPVVARELQGLRRTGVVRSAGRGKFVLIAESDVTPRASHPAPRPRASQ